MPEASNGGAFLHPTVQDMAAAYLFRRVKNHAFADGNKRIGAMAAYTFLRVNSYDIDATEEPFEHLTFVVASGECDKDRVAVFFHQHAGAAS